MPKTRIKAVVIVVSILFASTLSMFAQASQKPGSFNLDWVMEAVTSAHKAQN